MVPVNLHTEFLIADARAALRRRASESGRTELTRAFAAWLSPSTDPEFAALVREAATREGAQQHYQTVAILGFAAHAGVLGAAQIDPLKRGLRRQAGREVVIDELPAAFCSDAVGILGIILGTKAAAEAELTREVVKWVCKFLKRSYDAERTEDWEKCLFAVADLQLGSPLKLPIPKSPGIADVRTAFLAKGVVEDSSCAESDRQATLTHAIRELPQELSFDRAALRFAAVESVVQASVPLVGATGVPLPSKKTHSLSDRDRHVHDVIGGERFRTLTNAQIMKEPSLRRQLRQEFNLAANTDAAKSCLDRIRKAEGYPLSRGILEKRSNSQ